MRILLDGFEYCVTKYNVRPADYAEYTTGYNAPTVASEKEIPVEVSNFTKYYSDTSVGNNYCRILNTDCSTKDSPEGDYDEYPACGRTVCSYTASRTLCAAYEAGGNNCNDGEGNFTAACKGLWGYPTHPKNNSSLTQSPIFKYISPTSGVYDVQHARSLFLCDIMPGFGLPYIGGIVNAYHTAANVSCGMTYCDLLNGKSEAHAVNGYVSVVMSVRCVLPKVYYYYYPATGGGGSAGAYAENIEIPSEVLEKCSQEESDCSLIFTVGKGGTYGSVITSKTVTEPTVGVQGGSSSVEVKDGSELLWSYTVLGGNGGISSLYQVAGIGGEALPIETSCKTCLGSTCEDVPCTKTSEKGGDGVVGEKGFGLKAISSAKGAVGALSPSKSYGKGGDGGFFSNSSYFNGQGGSNGYIKITYEGKAQGAPGGGGGGGAYAKVLNVPVGSSAELPVTVGVGGSSPSLFDGNDGGDSSLAGAYIAGGGKGGKKGAPEGENTVLKLGTAGEGGVLNPITLKSDVKGESNNGENGFDGSKTTDTSFTIGGNGGASGVSVSMQILEKSLINACGGFVTNRQACYDSTGGQVSANGSQFDFIKPSRLYQKGDFGSAGQGGAGGGWKFDNLGYTYTGNGGKGNDGYVYVWW